MNLLKLKSYWTFGTFWNFQNFRNNIQNFEKHSILNQRASPLKYQLIARDSIRRQPIILQTAKVNNKSNRGKLITNGWMFHLLVRFALCDRWSLKRWRREALWGWPNEAFSQWSGHRKGWRPVVAPQTLKSKWIIKKIFLCLPNIKIHCLRRPKSPSDYENIMKQWNNLRF